MSFIQDEAPHLLIFDFDQTLCETKSGCVPDKLKHGLSPYLFQLALAWQVLVKKNLRNETRSSRLGLLVI